MTASCITAVPRAGKTPLLHTFYQPFEAGARFFLYFSRVDRLGRYVGFGRKKRRGGLEGGADSGTGGGKAEQRREAEQRLRWAWRRPAGIISALPPSLS